MPRAVNLRLRLQKQKPWTQRQSFTREFQN